MFRRIRRMVPVKQAYKVEGMTCQGCVNAVTRALGRTAPAAKVTVDLAGGKVEVDGDIRPEQVAAAIAAAGFTVSGQTT